MLTADSTNVTFWDELCGTHLAMQLGITDHSAASLRRFDDWYLDYYSYLETHIPFASLAGEKVLEIGLGYGTVAQKLMEAGAQYHGLDIAEGPVALARHRAALLGVPSDIRQGNALAIPYPDDTFDRVFSIGCLHHTGNLSLAMREVHRVVKDGGQVMIMVYNALSYRHWKMAPWNTLRRWVKPDFEWANAEPHLRAAYDTNQEGAAAPCTTFVSRREARSFLRKMFRAVKVTPRNIGEDILGSRLWSRPVKNACLAQFVGLDLYIDCIK
jgi:ubiquinone/menaquinone biosynthesis C-methylase UbiE